MIIRCKKCGVEITLDERYRLRDVDGIYGILCSRPDCAQVESQGSGENTSSEVAASTSRSKENTDG